MADRIPAFRVTVPAGTAVAAPVTVDVSFPQATVTEIEIVIPDGHAGFTGLALAQAQQQVIPDNDGNWIISNDEKIRWPVANTLDNGNWQAVMYNTDVYDHSFYVRFLLDNPTAPAATTAFATGTPLIVGDAVPSPQPDTGVAPILAGTPRPVEV